MWTRVADPDPGFQTQDRIQLLYRFGSGCLLRTLFQYSPKIDFCDLNICRPKSDPVEVGSRSRFFFSFLFLGWEPDLTRVCPDPQHWTVDCGFINIWTDSKELMNVFTAHPPRRRHRPKLPLLVPLLGGQKIGPEPGL